jgi:hypothetical protein
METEMIYQLDVPPIVLSRVEIKHLRNTNENQNPSTSHIGLFATPQNLAYIA